MFRNKQFLTNIRTATKKPLTLASDEGLSLTTLEEDLMNFGPVWYNPNALANILSLASVWKKCRVTMDTAQEAAIIVHRKNGSLMKFTEFKNRLYFYDVPNCNNTKAHVSDYSFVTTVENNKSIFTHREIQGADKARDLYVKLGRPGQSHFEDLLGSRYVLNCDVSVADAKCALFIYGPEIYSLKGKLTRHKPTAVPTFVPKAVPDYVLKHHRNVMLTADFLYRQGQPYLHTKSRKLKLRTLKEMTDRKKQTILTKMTKVFDLYTSRDFIVVDLIMDLEFE